MFREARSIAALSPIFERAASDGEYKIVSGPQDRIPVVLIGGPRMRRPSPRSSRSIRISLPALTLHFACGRL